MELRTKVVATVGPATASREAVDAVIRAGASVIRINFAHGTHDTHRQVVGWVREVCTELGVPVAILADLAGPKIRIGALDRPVELTAGQIVELAPAGEIGPGDDALPSTYPELAADVGPGSMLLLDDGRLELRVVSTAPPRVTAEVVRGGTLNPHKGLNLPGVRVSAPALTAKDRRDLELAVELEVEYVGLSFVQSPDDVEALRELIPPGMLIVAKIEKDVAVERIDGILAMADAVMVARGDLGVELPFERVPVVQKQIIQEANRSARPVITATQMLESMIDHPRPTRAEASDVANALFDGTDAVMLSGETAVGSYPVDAVRAMVSIARETEGTTSFVQGPNYDVAVRDRPRSGATPTEHSIAAATVGAVSLLGARAVVTLTKSGFTSRLVSSYRPPVPILGVCADRRVYRQLALVWGVIPIFCDLGPDPSYEEVFECARRALLERGLAAEGDRVPVTAGSPFFHVAGTTNMLKVEVL